MEALLLAAGLGTRLKPYTDFWPKCLMPINGRALLDYWISDLRNCGISHIYVNTYHHNEIVESFLSQKIFRDYVSVLNEKTLLGTGGTLVNFLEKHNIRDNLLVAHCDNYVCEGLEKFVEIFENQKIQHYSYVMGFNVKSTNNFGIFHIDSNHVAKSFFEKDPKAIGDIANGAIYIFNSSDQKLIESIPHMYDISVDLIPKLMGKLKVYVTEKCFIDIGSPINLKFAMKQAKKESCHQIEPIWVEKLENIEKRIINSDY